MANVSHFLIRQDNEQTPACLYWSLQTVYLRSWLGKTYYSEPAKLEFFPNAHMDRTGTNVFCSIVSIGTRGHQRPETGGIFTRGVAGPANRCVPELCAKTPTPPFSGSTYSRRSNRTPNFDATKAVGSCSFWSVSIVIDIPAVTPNGIYPKMPPTSSPMPA
jgi:hypothetical protein